MKQQGIFSAVTLFAGITAMMVGMIGLQGCQKEARSETIDEKPTVKSVNVEVLTLTRQPFDEMVTLHGTLQPDRIQNVSSEIGGKLVKLLVDDGDYIAKGKLIGRIDVRLLQAQRDQAAAPLQTAEADYQRFATLREKGSVTQQDYEAAKARVEQARAVVQALDIQIAQGYIKAPFSGHIVKKYVEEGEIIAPGAPVVQIARIETLKLVVGLPEKDVSYIKEGAAANNTPISMDTLQVPATVTKVGLMADALSRTFPVELTVMNKDLSLRAGMQAKLQLTRRHFDDSIVVPYNALRDTKNGRIAYVVNGDVAEVRTIIMSGSEGDFVRIDKGLEAGDKLVIVGYQDIVNKQPVSVVQRHEQTSWNTYSQAE